MCSLARVIWVWFFIQFRHTSISHKVGPTCITFWHPNVFLIVDKVFEKSQNVTEQHSWQYFNTLCTMSNNFTSLHFTFSFFSFSENPEAKTHIFPSDRYIEQQGNRCTHLKTLFSIQSKTVNRTKSLWFSSLSKFFSVLFFNLFGCVYPVCDELPPFSQGQFAAPDEFESVLTSTLTAYLTRRP